MVEINVTSEIDDLVKEVNGILEDVGQRLNRYTLFLVTSPLPPFLINDQSKQRESNSWKFR